MCLGPFLSRSNESNFYAVQMAFYVPPDAQQTFFGDCRCANVGNGEADDGLFQRGRKRKEQEVGERICL